MTTQDDAGPPSLQPSTEQAVAPSPKLRWRRRGAVFALIGAVLPLLIMSSDRNWEFSVPVGLVGCLLGAWGILDLLGTFDDPAESVSERVRLKALLPRILEFVASVVAIVFLGRLAVLGVLPAPVFTQALAFPAAFFWLYSALFRGLRTLGVYSHAKEGERKLLSRAGFWLIALTTVLYLPLLGSFTLTDPWETHYGEVAREMLARDDWISLWWAQDGWFWSKPILHFWLQAVSFSLLGVRYGPDQMILGVVEGKHPQPEWAARLPIFLITLVGVYLIYKGASRAFGRRAGLLGGVVLTTMPYWYFLAHQSMTDMPYLAPLTAGMGLLLLGFHTDPEARVRVYEITAGSRSVRLSGYHLLFGLVILCLLPQVLYLVSRNLTISLGTAPYLRTHLDQFFSGSGGGNCGLPGNAACHGELPVDRSLQPTTAALIWAAVGAIPLLSTRTERRLQRLYFLGGWLCVVLSAMAKGAPGLVLPLFTVAVYILATRRWRDLLHLELGGLVMLSACLLLPWYVQMFMRHGPPFTDQLIFQHMYRRAFVHVHDTNAGDDVSFRYYVWQLGYGLFPWTGLAAAGLAWWVRGDREGGDNRSGAMTFLGLWFIVGFALFTISLTKFHHYIAPAVPPLAMLVGVLLDDLMQRRSSSAHGIESGEPGFNPARYKSVLLSSIALASSVLLLLAGRDLSLKKPAAGGYASARLVNLFSYNYTRPWPESLDFSTACLVFTFLSAGGCLLLVVPRWRPAMVVFLVALGSAWSAWGLDVYLFKTAPHWGQRNTITTYYLNRSGPSEKLVAYQMNWKGENFYTGNRVPAFVSTGDAFKSWVAKQKQQGTRVLFFTTEQGRLSTLKAELGPLKSFKLLTTKEQNNKFFLARVEL